MGDPVAVELHYVDIVGADRAAGGRNRPTLTSMRPVENSIGGDIVPHAVRPRMISLHSGHPEVQLTFLSSSLCIEPAFSRPATVRPAPRMSHLACSTRYRPPILCLSRMRQRKLLLRP